MPPTEYAARQPQVEDGEKPVTVLVTGFGPFLEKVPINSSWEIACRLPALIPTSSTNKTPIHIRVHHEAIRVAYNTVVKLIPSLLPPKNPAYPEPDVVLHIGLAAGRRYFAIEEGSSRDIYDQIPDVDGERFTDDTFAKFPVNLNTSFDTSDVLNRWQEHLGIPISNGDVNSAKFPDVRISQNAGNFLCGFIYYNSLAHYFSIKEDERPVVFLHVPDLSTIEEKLHEGIQVTVALIKALVESRRKAGLKETRTNGTTRKTNGVQTDNNFV